MSLASNTKQKDVIRTEVGNTQVLLEVFLGRACTGEGLVLYVLEGRRERRGARYNREALGPDPGKNNLGRCGPKALRSFEDWFIDRTTWVKSDGTCKIFSVSRW